MRPMTQEAQAGRNKTISAAVSESEEWQVKLVSKKTGRSVSDLLREHNVSEIIEWGRRLEAAMDVVEIAS